MTTDFKSKFVYPVFVLRLLLFVSIATGFFLFIFIGIPSLTKQHSLLKAIGLISLGIILFAYLFFMLGMPLFTQRYNLIIQNGQVTLHDIFFGKHIKIDQSFKGFSLSNYSNRGLGSFVKTLIFYFHSGQKIEFPQFLYLNFKDIQPSLIDNSITYLGEEPFKWKNLLLRRYFFE